MKDKDFRYKQLTKLLRDLLKQELTKSNFEKLVCPECGGEALVYSLFLPEYSGSSQNMQRIPGKDPRVVKHLMLLSCQNPECGLQLDTPEELEKHGFETKVEEKPSPEFLRALKELFELF